MLLTFLTSSQTVGRLLTPTKEEQTQILIFLSLRLVYQRSSVQNRWATPACPIVCPACFMCFSYGFCPSYSGIKQVNAARGTWRKVLRLLRRTDDGGIVNCNPRHSCAIIHKSAVCLHCLATTVSYLEWLKGICFALRRLETAIPRMINDLFTFQKWKVKARSGSRRPLSCRVCGRRTEGEGVKENGNKRQIIIWTKCSLLNGWWEGRKDKHHQCNLDVWCQRQQLRRHLVWSGRGWGIFCNKVLFSPRLLQPWPEFLITMFIVLLYDFWLDVKLFFKSIHYSI